MQPTTLKRSLIPLFLLCVFYTGNSLAEERVIISDPDGFSITLRLIDRQTLMQQIRETRLTLRGQEADLQERIEHHGFSPVDTLITVAMPGGLLYAALKQNNNMMERKTLATLTHEINQLSADLLTFQSAASGLRMVALNP